MTYDPKYPFGNDTKYYYVPLISIKPEAHLFAWYFKGDKDEYSIPEKVISGTKEPPSYLNDKSAYRTILIEKFFINQRNKDKARNKFFDNLKKHLSFYITEYNNKQLAKNQLEISTTVGNVLKVAFPKYYSKITVTNEGLKYKNKIFPFIKTAFGIEIKFIPEITFLIKSNKPKLKIQMQYHGNDIKLDLPSEKTLVENMLKFETFGKLDKEDADITLQLYKNLITKYKGNYQHLELAINTLLSKAGYKKEKQEIDKNSK